MCVYPMDGDGIGERGVSVLDGGCCFSRISAPAADRGVAVTDLSSCLDTACPALEGSARQLVMTRRRMKMISAT